MATIIVRDELIEVNVAVGASQLWDATSAVARIMDSVQSLKGARVSGVIRITFDPKEED